MDLESKIASTLRFNNIPPMQAEALSSELVLLISDSIQHHQAETDYWKQQCEELDIDLMLSESRFVNLDQGNVIITKKRRSNF